MARFRGTVQGGRGKASRLGHKTTGLITTAVGWNCGVEVVCKVEKDIDIFQVYKVCTNGTRNLIAEVTDE